MLRPRHLVSQWPAILAFLLAAGPVAAHPHVFIDMSITAILDNEGHLTSIRLRWDYDDYVSLLVVEEKAADTDGDGSISATEMAPLDGFDMTWAEGFDGDTTVALNGTDLALLPGPREPVTGWEEGHLWSEHTRILAAPAKLSDGPVTTIVQDVSDYTAYSLLQATLRTETDGGIPPANCRIAPATEDADSGTGFLATLGLFVFGSDARGLEPRPGGPRASVSRVVLTVGCTG
jgi:hypothetical protein